MISPENNNYPAQEFPQKQEKTLEGFSLGVKSLESEKHPSWNEDAVFAMKDKGSFGVFDGMGGHTSGDVASEEAKNYVVQTLEKSPQGLSLAETQAELEGVVFETHEQLLKLTEENPALEGMGTTALIVKIWEGARGERKVVIAHVGDGRAYVLRADGKMEQITRDDNIITKTIKDPLQARALQEKLNNVKDSSSLSELEQILFKHRN